MNDYSKEETVEPTPGKAFYQRQIAALEALDMDALMAQYYPDATIIGFDFTVKGHDSCPYLTVPVYSG